MLVHEISINESVDLEEFTTMTITGIGYQYTTFGSEASLSYAYYGSTGSAYKKNPPKATAESNADPQIKKQATKSP